MRENANRETVSPLDLFNPYTEYTTESKANQRLEICKECPFYIKLTHQCQKCGCIMNVKTKLLHASCPIGRW